MYMEAHSLVAPSPMASMTAGPDLIAPMGRITAAGRVVGRKVSGAAEAAAPASRIVFSATPTLAKGKAVLFDSANAPSRGGVPEEATLSRLVVRFPGKAPDPQGVDPQLALWIFVDDLTTPRARVRLVDVIQQGGERPLNLRVARGEAVRIILVDPSGAWAAKGKAPQLELTLGW
jgi:hypothetical protein